MARGAVALGAAATGGAVVLLVGGTLLAVILRAPAPAALEPADWAAVRFTLTQAALSAIFSVALAVPVARALARRRFRGRAALITLLGAPFILPVIVAVMGLVAVFGRGGLVNAGLGALGLQPVSVYGLQGVVLAHVFFNMPLSVRLILQGWQAIPAERFRLAASLGFTPAQTFRHLEAPMLREVAPGAALVVFLICLTSFAVALTLGGGPAATTVELAIYQAFRFEFDLGRAALLAMVQLLITVLALALTFGALRRAGFGAGRDRPVERWDAGGRTARALDAGAIGFAALFLLLPLGTVALRGLPGMAEMPAAVLWSALRSLAVAGAAVALTLALALPLALAAARARLAEAAGTVALAASPLVIGTGLFLILRPVADPVALALPVTALVNAVMALPFALRALAPAAAAIEADYGRLADSLGMTGRDRLRWLILPRLRRPLGFALGLTAALSMGDLGVVALFADPARATLPLQIHALMGAYRMDAAAGASLLLLALSVGLFWIFDRGGRFDADA